jgi:spore germination protein (amino acid permease)
MTSLINEKKTSIGPRLYWSLLTMITLSYGLLNLPYQATAVMGNNAYFAVPIALLLSFPPMLAIYLLMHRFPTSNLLQIGLKITGPILGRILGLGYLIALLFLLCLFTRERINVISDYLLESTPLLVLALIYLLSGAYLASRGVETISRLASFVLLPSLAVLFLLLVGVLPAISINRLRPIFNPDLSIYLPGGFSILYAFYPPALMGLITPYLRGIQREIPRLTLFAALILLILYILVIVVVIGLFGSDYLRRFAFPALEVIQAIEFPYLLLEQAGLFMIIVLTAIALVGSAFVYYAIGLGLSQVVGVLDYKRMLWLLIPIKLFLIMFPQNIGETKEFINYAVSYGWIPLFGLPVFLYLLALALGKREGRR